MHHKNISFREAVLELGSLYRIDVVMENEQKKTKYQTQQEELFLQIEEFHEKLKVKFVSLPRNPLNDFLEAHFSEIGYLESIDILINSKLNTQKNRFGSLTGGTIEKDGFYAFPFQTERSEIFGFLFAQLDVESNLEIPVVKKEFKFFVSNQFQRVINLPQARRNIIEKSFILTTNIFDLCFLLKHGIKNGILVQQEDISNEMYVFFSKFVSKIFMLLSENSKNILYSNQEIMLFVRWIHDAIPEKIKFYLALDTENIAQWIFGAQKLKHTDQILKKQKNSTVKLKKNQKDDVVVFSKTSDFYHRILLHPSSIHVVDYLEKRGFTIEDIKYWKLGFCPKDSVLTRSLLKQKVDISIFLDLGVLRLSSKTKQYYDFFYDRFVIPITNHFGDCIALGGRILNEQNKAPKYINSSESSLFSKSKILFNYAQASKVVVDEGYVIVVEGYMDCMTLVKHGIKNTVAVMGTALTTEHLTALAQITKRVILCFDTDSAGKQAIKKSFLANLKFPELLLETIEIPVQKDPDEFVKSHGPKAFLQIIRDDAHLVYERVLDWIQEESSDFEDFILNLKHNFKFCEFPEQSILGNRFEDYLFQMYSIKIRDVFTKNTRSDTSLSVTTLEMNFDCVSQKEFYVSVWTIKFLLEIKLLFSFFYCQFSDLPKKLHEVLKTHIEQKEFLNSDFFNQACKNHISASGMLILFELFSFCTKKGYTSCLEITEQELANFTDLVQIFVAYLQNFVPTLMSFGFDYLLRPSEETNTRGNIFDCENVWSEKNTTFLRLQRKNVELALKHNRLIAMLVENLIQLEIVEIDFQLEEYSKVHFNSETSENFAYLVQERATRRLLLIG